MTRATYNAWVKDTWVIEIQDSLWQIGVKSSYAKDWLENRLAKTILRSLENCSGQSDLSLEFVVSEADSYPKSEIVEETEPGDYLPTDLSTPNYSQFVPHIKDINRQTGYLPLANYYLNFWDLYLVRRWKSAGQRAFRLWQKLVALDTRKVTDQQFTNWSPIITTNYDQLGKMLNVDHSVIKGREGYCQNYEDAQKYGQPRGQDCCGHHEEQGCLIKTSRTKRKHCYYWRTGVLEVLDSEGLVALERMGKNKHHKLRLQIWRSLPYLTPYQSRWLTTEQQEAHLSWLLASGPG